MTEELAALWPARVPLRPLETPPKPLSDRPRCGAFRPRSGGLIQEVRIILSFLLFAFDGDKGRLLLSIVPPESDAVWFTTKGQVVIPLRLRKQYHIEEGTKAMVEATPEGILLKPVTRHSINRLRGILKRKPGAKLLAQEWAEHKGEERALENKKHGRSPGSR